MKMIRKTHSLPSHTELEELFLQKYGSPQTVGWSARRRWDSRYYLPADVYEALVKQVVFEGCKWIDVGGGRDVFPENPSLAETLVSRIGRIL